MPKVGRGARPRCVACGDTGVSSTGRPCEPCLKNGLIVKAIDVIVGTKLRESQAASISLRAKVKYVKSQGQTRDHHCHWPGCDNPVPPALWGCKRHWMMLPKRLRDLVWATYNPGQERDMTPSVAYCKVAQEVQDWIAENYPPEPSLFE